MVGWGEPEFYGEYEPGYAEYEPVGYFAEDYPFGYYGEEYPLADYGEEYPLGYFAEDYLYAPMSEYEPMGWYGQAPEMNGYGEYEPLAEEYPGMAYYGEPDLSGYVRETEPTFNASCGCPTNIHGFGEEPGMEGYVAPTTVNATCDQFTPQPGSRGPEPETFKPLW